VLVVPRRRAGVARRDSPFDCLVAKETARVRSWNLAPLGMGRFILYLRAVCEGPIVP